MNLKIEGFRKFGLAGILLYLMWSTDLQISQTLLVISSVFLAVAYMALNFWTKIIFKDRTAEEIAKITGEEEPAGATPVEDDEELG